MSSEEAVDKWRASMIVRYGSEEAWKAHMKEQAIKGGKAGKTPLSSEEAARRGKLGGLARKKKYEQRQI